MTNPNECVAGILILGIGNVLMGDEGVGVHFAHMLEKENLPPGVDLLEGGTSGFQLMSDLENHRTVIMIDATLDELPPGTIRMLEPRYAKDFPQALSTHDIGLKDVIGGLALLDRLPKIYLFVVSIPAVQPMRMQLSPEIEAVLPELKGRVFDLIESLSGTSPEVRKN